MKYVLILLTLIALLFPRTAKPDEMTYCLVSYASAITLTEVFKQQGRPQFESVFLSDAIVLGLGLLKEVLAPNISGKFSSNALGVVSHSVVVLSLDL